MPASQRPGVGSHKHDNKRHVEAMRPCRPFPLVLLPLLVALALVWPARCESEVGQHQALGLDEDAIGGPWARAPRREQHLQRWRLAREEKARMQRLGLLGDLLEVRQGCSCSQLTAHSSSQCSIHALQQYSSVGCDDVLGAMLTYAARFPLHMVCTPTGQPGRACSAFSIATAASQAARLCRRFSKQHSIPATHSNSLRRPRPAALHAPRGTNIPGVRGWLQRFSACAS